MKRGSALDYPYRDDALRVWGAIEQWARSYMEIHYSSDAHVAQDNEGSGRSPFQAGSGGLLHRVE